MALFAQPVFSIFFLLAASAAQNDHPQAARPADDDRLARALEQRRHSGDLSFLQGCDLTDLDNERGEAIATLAKLGVQPPAATATVRPSQSDLSAAVHAAARADQAVRNTLKSSANLDGEAGAATLSIRMNDVCRQDLENGNLLLAPEAAELLTQSTDRQVLSDLLLLALHADHLPALQKEFGDIWLARYAAVGLPAEPGLRLLDRSRINFWTAADLWHRSALPRWRCLFALPRRSRGDEPPAEGPGSARSNARRVAGSGILRMKSRLIVGSQGDPHVTCLVANLAESGVIGSVLDIDDHPQLDFALDNGDLSVTVCGRPLGSYAAVINRIKWRLDTGVASEEGFDRYFQVSEWLQILRGQLSIAEDLWPVIGSPVRQVWGAIVR